MYNGIEYESMSAVPFEENTLASNLVQTVYMDRNDILWIGTYAGLDRYDIATGTFTNYPVGNNVVVSIFRDSADLLWVGTLDGLGCMHPGTDEFVIYKPDRLFRSIPDKVVRNLYEDMSGTVYACTYNGLYQYDSVSDSFIPSAILLPGNPALEGVVYAIEQDKKGDWWVAKWGTGFIRIDRESFAYTVFPLNDNRIYCMNSRIDQDLIIAGTWGGGLNVLDKQTGSVTSYTQSSGPGKRLTNDIVYPMYIDTQGLFWIGTNGGGLTVCDPDFAWFSSLYADPEGSRGLVSGKTNMIFEDIDGRVWISISNKGLTRFDPATGTITPMEYNPAKPALLPSLGVYSILRMSDNELYVGCDNGLYAWDRTTDRFSAVPWFSRIKPPGKLLTVYSLARTPDGSVWIGTYENGVYRYNPQDDSILEYHHDESDPGSLSDNLVYFIYEDRSSDVWIGTNRGLNRINSETGALTAYYYNRSNPAGISSNTLYACYEHSDGTLWFGTRNGGVCSYDPVYDTFSHVTSKDGLPSDTVSGIAPSSGDFLWLATHNGLVRFDMVGKTALVYKASDGLVSQQFNTVHYSARSGNRYFGTPLGVMYFAEKDIRNNYRSNPRMAISSVTVNNETIRSPAFNTKDAVLRLRSDQVHINIGYTALDFSPYAKYTYSYMLEGFNEEWVRAGSRRYAMFTNLSPGLYRFTVKIDFRSSGAGEPGTEESGTSLTFRIDKPVFLRWYAWIVYALFCMFSVYVFLRIRKSAVLERKVGELEEVATSLRTENTHLESLSYQDSLTGIPNRRYFKYAFQREWAASRIREEPLRS